MKGFVYFVERPEVQAALGMEEAPELLGMLGESDCVACQASRSPSGRPGVLVFARGVDRGLIDQIGGLAGGTTEGVVWAAWNADASVMVGMWTGAVPGPEDLRRGVMLPGISAKLEDGNEWVLPRLMYWTGGSALPQSFGLDAKGEPVSEPLRRYAGVAGRSRRLWDYLLNDHRKRRGEGHDEGALRMEAREFIGLAVEGLGLNYRVSAAEVRLLQLVSIGATGNLYRVCAALVDLDLFRRLEVEEEAEKKTVGVDGS